MAKKYRYQPDYAVPPGATLRETLEAKGITQKELAVRTGLTEKHLSQIVQAAASITHGTALKLERALGIPARFWNNLERDYQESKMMIHERTRLEEDCEWVKQIPHRELANRGLIRDSRDRVVLLREVLSFFGVSSVEAWRNLWMQPDAVFRRSQKVPSRPGLVATWIRMGELLAEKSDCRPYSRQRFRSALRQVRSLTVQPARVFQPEIERLCAQAGVAVVFVREIPGAGISGATRWLSAEKAMVLLSLRYKRDDQLWFTFFHEAGHILLHGKKAVFLEGEGQTGRDEKEREADRFAADILIPPRDAAQVPYLNSKAAIVEFAESIGVSPGIVAGRWQHETQQYSRFQNLKRKLEWAPSGQ
jgi:HTH-type transcriptional regulator/antitoxin HigA